MELHGTRDIAAPREAVWAALNDPEVLKASIPGCQELTGGAAEGFEAVVKQKVGPVSATFRGKVTLEDVVEGESYRIVGEGSGGVAGFAKGAADVKLSDLPDGGTQLTYEVDAKVGGKLAQLGSRVIDGFARSMADKFFDNFRGIVEGEGDGAAEAAAPEPEAKPAAPAAPQPKADAPKAKAESPARKPEPEKAEAKPTKKKGWLSRLFG